MENHCPDCNSVNHNPECNECLTNEISTKEEPIVEHDNMRYNPENPKETLEIIDEKKKRKDIDTNLMKRMNDIKESHEQLGTCHPSDIGYMIEQIELLHRELFHLEDIHSYIEQHTNQLETKLTEVLKENDELNDKLLQTYLQHKKDLEGLDTPNRYFHCSDNQYELEVHNTCQCDMCEYENHMMNIHPPTDNITGEEL